MRPVYHIVGLSYCQPDPSLADNYYDQEIEEPILETFGAVLAKGELLAPSQFGSVSSPTLIDAMAGDNHYVFLGKRSNGPSNYECPEEYSYGFAFDAYQLIELGCGVRSGDLIVTYEYEIMNFAGDVSWSQQDLEKVNQFLAQSSLDPVEEMLALDGYDEESKRSQRRARELTGIVALLESPPVELRHRLQRIADQYTMFGNAAIEMLERQKDLEFVMPEKLSLTAMDHAIMAGREVSWDELTRLYDVRVVRQRELWK
jgi:hypothetical protein